MSGRKLDPVQEAVERGLLGVRRSSQEPGPLCRERKEAQSKGCEGLAQIRASRGATSVFNKCTGCTRRAGLHDSSGRRRAEPLRQISRRIGRGAAGRPARLVEGGCSAAPRARGAAPPRTVHTMYEARGAAARRVRGVGGRVPQRRRALVAHAAGKAASIIASSSRAAAASRARRRGRRASPPATPPAAAAASARAAAPGACGHRRCG